MSMKKYSLFLLLFLISCLCSQGFAEDGKRNVVYLIHSYSPAVPCASDWTNGIRHQFKKNKLDVDFRVRYLDAKYWSYEEEKAHLRVLIDTILANRASLVITEGDEATASFLTSGHAKVADIPVLAMGVQHPNIDLLGRFPRVFGYTCEPDYLHLLELSIKLFPNSKSFLCINDDGYLSRQAFLDFQRDWAIFNQHHSGYTLRVYDTTKMTSFDLVTQLTYPRYVSHSIAMVPKWSPFIAVLGKNSKCPFFTNEAIALRNGAYAALSPDPYQFGLDVGDLAVDYLNHKIIPQTYGIRPYGKDIMQFDYKQLMFFHTPYEDIKKEGKVVNFNYYTKYHDQIIASIIILLIAFSVMIVLIIISWRKQQRVRLALLLKEEVSKKLFSQKEEFDNILHSMSDCLATYSIDKRLHYVNYSLRKLINGGNFPINEIEPEKFEGLPAGSIYSIIYEDKSVLEELLDKTLVSKTPMDIPKGAFIQFIESDQVYPISGSLFPIISNQEIVGVALNFRNIAEEEINKHLFHLAVTNAQIIPWRFSFATNQFTFLMNSLEALGYGEVTLLDLSGLKEKIHPDDFERVKTMFTCMHKDKPNTFQIRIADVYGKYYWYEVSCSYMVGVVDNKKNYHIVGVCQNIQQYKDSEQVLIQSRDAAREADKMKTAFLANISHEIRTPLNAIVGFTSVLPDILPSASKEDIDVMVDSIQTNSDLLLSLIRDVMDMSSIQSDSMNYTFNEYQLNRLLYATYHTHKSNCPEGVNFVLDIPDDPGVDITTDDEKLDHILANLLTNAFKFTTTGIIKLGYDVNKETKHIVIYVEDTGCGISSCEQPYIFERFYKTNEFKQGAGLGLSLCKLIAENLGGKITVHSVVGTGSRFELWLPG